MRKLSRGITVQFSSAQVRSFLRKNLILLTLVSSVFSTVVFYFASQKSPEYAYYGTLKIGQFTRVSGDEVKVQSPTLFLSGTELRAYLLGKYSEHSLRRRSVYILDTQHQTKDGLTTLVISIRAQNEAQAQQFMSEVVQELNTEFGGAYNKFIADTKNNLDDTNLSLETKKNFLRLEPTTESRATSSM